jgi:hypothetical protein
VIVVRVIVGFLAVVGVGAVLGSMLRSVVVPRGVPARLARAAFLSTYWLLRLRLRLTGRSDYATRDRIFAVGAPLGPFAQLATWGVLIWLLFAVLFWSLTTSTIDGAAISHALELSGSSMLTLGFDSPHGLSRQLASFAAAAVGLALLALVIAYLPTLYGTFSRREQLITKLTVRVGAPSSGPALLSSTWELGRFEQLEEVWEPWEDWFIELGESHTSYPQLVFFRSPRSNNHWVLASEAVLDGAALLLTACDVRVRPAASYVCTQGSMPCSRSPTSSPFRTVHRNPAPRSSSLRRSSTRRSAIYRASVSRCATIDRPPGSRFELSAPATSLCSRSSVA